MIKEANTNLQSSVFSEINYEHQVHDRKYTKLLLISLDLLFAFANLFVCAILDSDRQTAKE